MEKKNSTQREQQDLNKNKTPDDTVTFISTEDSEKEGNFEFLCCGTHSAGGGGIGGGGGW